MAITTTKLESNRGFALIENGASAITNSTTETSLFSTTVKGGQMSTNKIAELQLVFHVTTPAISIPTLVLKVKLGTAVTTIATGTLGSSITDKPFILTASIANQNATNVQYMYAKLDNSSLGINLFSALGAGSTVADATWAVDTAVDQVLSVTAQFGGLSATTSIVTKLVKLNLS